MERSGGPFGAVVVLGGVVLGAAGNSVLRDSDPTAHAEVNAIRQACRTIGSHDLSGMERQEAALRAWLADHPGDQLAEALVDAGVSAGYGQHRTAGALARFIEAGRTSAVPPGFCLVPGGRDPEPLLP